MAAVTIDRPLVNTCLPTANAVVDGTYDSNFKVIPNVGVTTGTVYFVRVTVGTDPYQDSSPPSPNTSDDWTVTFTTLTAATGVAVTAQLMKSVNGAAAVPVGNPATIEPVDVTAVCVSTPTTGDPFGSATSLSQPAGNSGSAATAKATATATTTTGTLPLHTSVAWQYDSAAYDLRLLRGFAVVTKFVTVNGDEGPGAICAISDAVVHHGFVSAIVPRPEHECGVRYEYQFMLFKRGTTMLLTQSVPFDLETE
jgi:hypothetical protein